MSSGPRSSGSLGKGKTVSENSCAISVVVPTMGRTDVLEECVRALTEQDLPPEDYEVLAVYDDADDEPERAVARAVEGTKCRARAIEGEHKGVGPARNLGVQEARGKVVLIIGNDIIGAPDLVSRHLAFHTEHADDNVVVLGRTKLHRDVLNSPFMRIWGDIPFWELDAEKEVPPWFFFTGNVSFKRSFFVESGGFDESFRRIGFEDTEIGFRLLKNGMKFRYNKDAVGYHNHAYTAEEACRQQVNHGYNFGILIEKLKDLEMEEYVPLIAERYGIVGWQVTKKALVKNLLKKYILHHGVIMIPLLKVLNLSKNPGAVSAFLYPKIFSYYTNQGYKLYKKERG